MSEETALTALPATPITYRFVSVHRVVGFCALRTTPELLAAQELPLNLGVEGVTASLSIDPSAALTEVDRGTAIGHLMLLGFQGQRAPADVLKAVHEQAAKYAEERLTTFGASSVYLVLIVRGEIVSTPTEIARDLGDAVYAFDAFDKKALRAQYAPWVSAALTAVALAANTHSDIVRVAEGVAFTLPDGRPLYSVTITGGNVGLIISRPATDTDARAIEKVIAPLMRDDRLRSPSRLLVDALRSTSDRLKAFVFAWAALEMVIRKYTAGCETGEWIGSVPVENRDAAAAICQAYLDGSHQPYSLAQKTRVFALTHHLGTGEDLAAQITRIRTAYREPLYHQGAIGEELPVEAVVALLRKVIDAAVNSR
jgi:hypothetical protein